jgi:hypothetical protein
MKFKIKKVFFKEIWKFRADRFSSDDMEMTQCIDQVIKEMPPQSQEEDMNVTVSDFGKILAQQQVQEDEINHEEDMNITKVFNQMHPKQDDDNEICDDKIANSGETQNFSIHVSKTPSLHRLLNRNEDMTTSFAFGRDSISTTPSLQKLLSRLRDADSNSHAIAESPKGKCRI